MKRAIIGAVMALCLVGCGEAKDQALTPEVLESQDRLEKISNRLDPEDRALFGKYVMQRKLAASGMPTLTSGMKRDPKTVGEAVSVMRKIEAISAECDAKLEQASARMNAVQIGSDNYVARYNAEVNAYNTAQDECAARRAAVEP